MTSSVVRKLKALSYPFNPRDIILTNEEDLKQLIYWIEDSKIRAISEDKRKVIVGDNWKSEIQTYLTDLKCPYGFEKFPVAVVDWLLSYAIRKEHGKENNNIRNALATVVEMECEECPPLDVNTVQFKNGVNLIRDYLRVPNHQDYLQVLAACRILIENRLDPNFVAAESDDKLIIGSSELGFDLKDKVLNDVAKILRLLHIEELRNLQTNINECIVSAQSQTANPKTDTELGQVGR